MIVNSVQFQCFICNILALDSFVKPIHEDLSYLFSIFFKLESMVWTCFWLVSFFCFQKVYFISAKTKSFLFLFFKVNFLPCKLDFFFFVAALTTNILNTNLSKRIYLLHLCGHLIHCYSMLRLFLIQIFFCSVSFIKVLLCYPKSIKCTKLENYIKMLLSNVTKSFARKHQL